MSPSDNNIKTRLAAAVRECLITEEPHRLIVKAAAVMDIGELWRKLTRLDLVELDTAYRLNCEKLSRPEDIESATQELAAILEVRKLRELSPYGFAGEKELQTLLGQLELSLLNSAGLGAMKASKFDRVRMLAESDEAVYEEVLRADRARIFANSGEEAVREKCGPEPREPGQRRRRFFLPIVAMLKNEHKWTYNEIASLVIGEQDKKRPDKIVSLWLTEPCPRTTKYYWTNFARSELAATLKNEVFRANSCKADAEK